MSLSKIRTANPSLKPNKLSKNLPLLGSCCHETLSLVSVLIGVVTYLVLNQGESITDNGTPRYKLI